MLTGDTIAAIATAPGRSARGVVRLSGPGTMGALERALGCAVPDEPGAHVLRLSVGGASLPAMVIVFRAPRSYTGEDAAEAQLPGNPILLGRALELLLACEGVRLASPGEFTARAFLAGRMSLEMAEGVAMTIAARSDEELSAAGRLLSGEWGASARALADELASALALVEAGIDFTDQEDVVAIAPADLTTRLASALERVRAWLGAGDEGPARDVEAAVALVGPASAGKSTLFNALLGRERSVVAAAPGTTRDVLEERLDLAPETVGAGGAAVRLRDLPGLDANPGAGEAALRAQGAALEAIGSADVLVLCDPSGRFTAPPGARAGARVVRVRTKADLPLDAGEEGGGIGVCALDGWNLGALRRAIADAALVGGATVGGAEAALLPRHRRALADAEGALVAALEVAGRSDAGGPLADAEVVAGSMRSALDAVGSIVGRIGPDDVIGRVFATFCVGK